MIFLQGLTIKRMTKKLKAMQHNRQLNQPLDEIIAKEIAMYMTLASIYKSLKNKKKFPFNELMAKECLRAAASLDSRDAQYELGLALLEEAKCRDALEKEGLFTSASNQRQAEALFKESEAYFMSAEKLGHVLAKRMRGLCFINGWGVELDQEKGFDLIVASIDDEGSWDRVPQIFASMGLNKPEFFSAFGKHRAKK